MANRTITIIVRERGGFDVHEGERYSNELTWDEMLGQVASLTHSEISRPRYSMQTPEEWSEWEERVKRRTAAMEVSDG